jgi:hypothetical protein
MFKEIPAFAKSLENRDRHFAGAIKPVAETDPILTYKSACKANSLNGLTADPVKSE